MPPKNPFKQQLGELSVNIDELTNYEAYKHLPFQLAIKHYSLIYDQYFSLVEKTSNAEIRKKAIEIRRKLVADDLFYLLWWGCSRTEIIHPFVFDRCREVQEDPDGYLDLWARGHFKSSIITFGQTIKDILNNPELTFGIFAYNQDLAKTFLRQIKTEFENNTRLKLLFPDVLWSSPARQAPKWSEADGIIVKRKSNAKECTVEAWGLVDAMPTGKHFTHRIYDDMIEKRSISNPEMIKKVTAAWELSLSLGDGMVDGTRLNVERYIGTRYHLQDTYAEMMDRKAVAPRIYPATSDGSADFTKGVMLSEEELRKKYSSMGVYTFNAQMLLNPIADKVSGFLPGWWTTYTAVDANLLTRIIIVDPASKKKATSDYSCYWVVGLGIDQTWRVLEIVRDRLNLSERWRVLKELHVKYKPMWVFYEQFGASADIEHFHFQMELEAYNFKSSIVSLPCSLDVNPKTKAPLMERVSSSQMSKKNRIMRLVPLHEQGRILYPLTSLRRNYLGDMEDMLQTYQDKEYKQYPVVMHDDGLDSLSNIEDPVVKMLTTPPQHNAKLTYQQQLLNMQGGSSRANAMRTSGVV